MDYYRNADKQRSNDVAGLYNSVINMPALADGTEPVTLQELKDWGKIEQDADDALITALGKAARRVCEQYTGIGFLSRELTIGINNSNGGFALPYGPVTVDPTGVNEDGTAIDLVYNVGQLQSPFGRMTVTYTGGYTALPEDLKTALKAQFLFMYENRGEGTRGLSPVAEMILAPLRRVV